MKVRFCQFLQEGACMAILWLSPVQGLSKLTSFPTLKPGSSCRESMCRFTPSICWIVVLSLLVRWNCQNSTASKHMPFSHGDPGTKLLNLNFQYTHRDWVSNAIFNPLYLLKSHYAPWILGPLYVKTWKSWDAIYC